VSSSIPFVGLHAHDGFSVGDGLGFPDEHFDFAYENGLRAHAITNHGNMNSLPHMVMHLEKMRSEGKEFKAIYGMEAYFVPSVAEWKQEYEKNKALKKRTKKEEISATVIEDEGETRKAKNILNRRRHLVLLAQSQEGLNNLFKIVSLSYQSDNFYRYPRVDYEILKQNSAGIISTSACLGGVYAGCFWENRESGEEAVMQAMRATSEKMISIFGDRWYGELQWNSIPEQHELNQYIVRVCAEYDIKLISTADSHYPHPDAWRDRELYKRISWLGKKKPDWLSNELPESVDEIGYELYPKNGDQMWEAYKKYSAVVGVEYDDQLVLDSIKRTHHIATNMIEDFVPDNTVRLPDFVVPDGAASADQALRELCLQGLAARSLESGDDLYESAQYAERLDKELEVIEHRGFAKYFLTMKAVSDKAQDLSLVGPGRGSAAGALISYALNITQVDPIKYELLFERFLTRDGKGYPDIDYDVANPMRLKEHLIEEWGKTTVVPISNFNTLKLRSLIKDISKLYDIPFTEVNAVTSKMLLEATPLAKKKHGIKAGVYAPTFEEVMEFSDSLRRFLIKYPEVKTHIEALHGQVRSVSRHAGGVVIGEDLDYHMPLINSGGVTQTPWSEGQTVRHLEPMGFIKFDILGLSTIEMIEQAIVNILKRHESIPNPTNNDVWEYYNKWLHPNNLDLGDENVWKNIFQSGKFAGVFQFSQDGAQDLCKRVKPANIIDLSAITSIYRPGPLSAEVDKNYVSAKNNPLDIKYIHPIVRDVTESTYGFLIFQEQIAILAHKLGENVSLDEGNMLRKLLTKKGSTKGYNKKAEIHDKFIRGCVQKDIAKRDAEKLWSTFEYFSGYGFNKSHAISYCFISYQCAWLLNYYPDEWLAAFLDKEPESRKETAINIAKSFGYKIEPMNVNISDTTWLVSEDGKSLVQPLTSVKGLGEKAVEQIVAHRPFAAIEDFLFHEEISYSKLNKKAIDVLVRSQALNCLMDDRFSGLKHFWSCVAVDRPKSLKKFKENLGLYKPEGDFTEEEKIEFLAALTGGFPIHKVASPELIRRLEHHCIPPISSFDIDLKVAWFIPRKVNVKKTKHGKEYWIVEVIDSDNKVTKIKCWGVRPEKDKIFLNRPYMSKLEYSEQWGFSTRSVYHNFKLLA
jgi:DNA polymerase-3 subunit alpha